jgi:hypothetical protein
VSGTNKGPLEVISINSTDATIIRELKHKFYRKLPSENEEQGSGFRANSPEFLNQVKNFTHTKPPEQLSHSRT